MNWKYNGKLLFFGLKLGLIAAISALLLLLVLGGGGGGREEMRVLNWIRPTLVQVSIVVLTRTWLNKRNRQRYNLGKNSKQRTYNGIFCKNLHTTVEYQFYIQLNAHGPGELGHGKWEKLYFDATVLIQMI